MQRQIFWSLGPKKNLAGKEFEGLVRITGDHNYIFSCASDLSIQKREI